MTVCHPCFGGKVPDAGRMILHHRPQLARAARSPTQIYAAQLQQIMHCALSYFVCLVRT